MSEQYEMKVLPENSGNKLAITHTAIQAPVDADSIYVVVQSDVDLHRQLEIINRWREMVEHLQENNQLSAAGGAQYVLLNINAPKSGLRQTTDIAGVELDDVVIGVGVNLVASQAELHTQIDNAFHQLIDWVREQGFPVLS